MWGGQGFGRVTEVVGENSGAWVMPLTEVLEGGWPWILLLPSGVVWAWRHRKTSTGRWELGLLVGSALMVLPLRTQLPWYSHLLWPPIALLCGEALAELLKEGRPHWIPKAWQWMGALLLVSTTVLAAMKARAALPFPALFAAGLGLLIGGVMLSKPPQRQRQQGLAVLITGWSLGLLALWHSHLWLWELNEIWDPRPVAAQIRSLPPDAVVMLDGSTRPSLNWYAKRPLKELNSKPPAEFWLVSKRSRQSCSSTTNPAHADDWALWHCSSTDQP
jgi:4-amino-4-deoxy-L-arabinose transferase-like glycosyltransferase